MYIHTMVTHKSINYGAYCTLFYRRDDEEQGEAYDCRTCNAASVCEQKHSSRGMIIITIILLIMIIIIMIIKLIIMIYNNDGDNYLFFYYYYY